MQSNIEMFKRLQERITALEMRVEAIEGEKLRRIDRDEELKVTRAEHQIDLTVESLHIDGCSADADVRER